VSTQIIEPPREPAPEFTPLIYVYRVPRGVLPAIWPQVKGILFKGLPWVRGSWTLDNAKDYLLSGYYQLWVVTERGRVLAALLTEIHKTPSGKKVLEVPLAAGSRARDWFDQWLESATEYAHLRGVTELKFTGRYGWWRYLKPHGFKQEAVVMYREEI